MELCEGRAKWVALIAGADELTRFASTARYPGIDMPVSEEDAASALETARRVQRVVRQALGI
jgi:HEPN domain-containing protein